MELRPFGNTGMRVSALGFGGAEIGFDAAAGVVVDTLIGEAMEAGLNVVDTSAFYLTSEEKIGNALRGRRSRCLIFTKCGLHTPRSRSSSLVIRAGRAIARRVARLAKQPATLPEWDPRMLAWQIDQSLRRLQTDRVDLMQLHSCSEEILRQGDAIDVLQRAKQAGKTRFIGYSGDGAAARYATECGQFDALQTSVNIADQEALDLTLPLARERGMGVIAKRPIANGVWGSEQMPESIHNQAYWSRLRELQYDFLNDNDLAFEMALRFTLSVPGVNTAIVGTTSVAHWRKNADCAMRGALSAAEYNAIREPWLAIAQSDWAGQM